MSDAPEDASADRRRRPDRIDDPPSNWPGAASHAASSTALVEPRQYAKAVGVQPRTLEVFEGMGVPGAAFSTRLC